MLAPLNLRSGPPSEATSEAWTRIVRQLSPIAYHRLGGWSSYNPPSFPPRTAQRYSKAPRFADSPLGALLSLPSVAVLLLSLRSVHLRISTLTMLSSEPLQD
jgi:hypothetical protein